MPPLPPVTQPPHVPSIPKTPTPPAHAPSAYPSSAGLGALASSDQKHLIGAKPPGVQKIAPSPSLSQVHGEFQPQALPPQRFDGTSKFVVLKNAPLILLFLGCTSDTIFVIDSTSSVKNIFEKHRQYVENVVRELDISDQGHHVGVIEYASKLRNRVKISLADPQHKPNVTKRVHGGLSCLFAL